MNVDTQYSYNFGKRDDADRTGVEQNVTWRH